jgi:uncharacterized protein YidB (DUF937 family)
LAEVPLAARVVEVLADLGEGRSPRYRVGSGCIVAGRTVLTAAHVVAGAVGVQVRDPGKVLHTAVLDPVFIGDAAGPGPDLALVQITDPETGELPPMGLAAVDRDSTAGDPVERCHVVGYPQFMERPAADGSKVRDTADAVGHVPVLSGLAGGLLTVQVRTAPRPLPPKQTGLGDSEWSGMSGGPVIADGLLLAVVTEHAPRAGPSEITATPLTALEANPDHPRWGPGVAAPSAWWARLGVPGVQALQKLPARSKLRGDQPVRVPLAEVTDPFALEVHRPVQPDQSRPGLPVLPVYVPREHDAELARVGAAAVAGSSGIAVLVGGSSTGKTRACWEALRLLRDQTTPWRLWHPIDPSRPEAALRELPAIGPWTVVWLNEAQFYLDVSGGLGEQVAAGLRELLRAPAQAPVLVLATLWSEFWDTLTARPAAGTDQHAQARELLAGHDIPVPAAFTPAELEQLARAGDTRLDAAAASARDGQVVQFLAGVPELLARYRNAPLPAKALIHAAMDARRLGMRPALPQAFLEAAAPGYLTDDEWDHLVDDWLEQALAYTTAPCKGVSGPLTRIRSRPVRRSPDVSDSSSSRMDGPAYRLADYLDQVGRRTRRGQIPPAAFWAAAADCAHPGDLAALGMAADARGLYLDAAQLDKNAAAYGDPGAASRLVRSLDRLHPGDQRPARWAAAHAAVDDLNAVEMLLFALGEAGASEQVTTLADRAAAYAPLADPDSVARPLRDRLYGRVSEQVTTTLLSRNPAAHVSLDNPRAVAHLLDAMREVGASEQVTTLADRAAAHTPLDHPEVARLLRGLREAGASEQVTTLLGRNPAAHAPLDHRYVDLLLDALREAGASEQVTTLADRAAAHAPLHDPFAVSRLLRELRKAGASEQVTTLADRAAAHAPLDDPGSVATLLDALREAGASEQVTTLLARSPAAHAPLDDPGSVATLLDALRKAGASEQVTTLLARNPAAHAPLDHQATVDLLLSALRKAGASEQVTTLADRAAPLDNRAVVARLLRELQEASASEQVTTPPDRPAARTALDDPGSVAILLDALREAGASEQVTTLLARNLATLAARRGQQFAVNQLLNALREGGASTQAEMLIDRLPGEGMFRLFFEQGGNQKRFWFGRDTDGGAAEPWGWDDLADGRSE